MVNVWSLMLRLDMQCWVAVFNNIAILMWIQVCLFFWIQFYWCCLNMVTVFSKLAYSFIKTHPKKKKWLKILFVWIFEMKLDVYYFGCDFSDCCPHLYGCKLTHNVLTAAFSGLPQVSLVSLGIEMIQPGKSFLKFDCWSNKPSKNYEDLIQIMMSLFFTPINLRSKHFKFILWCFSWNVFMLIFNSFCNHFLLYNL